MTTTPAKIAALRNHIENAAYYAEHGNKGQHPPFEGTTYRGDHIDLLTDLLRSTDAIFVLRDVIRQVLTQPSPITDAQVDTAAIAIAKSRFANTGQRVDPSHLFLEARAALEAAAKA